MSSIAWRLLALAALTLFTLSAFAAEFTVGSIKTVVGGASVERNGSAIPAQEGFHLQRNDTLRTGADGRMGIILQDGTRISLGANTELHVNDFVYQPSEGHFSLVLRLVHGVMAYVSGKIASFSPQSVKVETPVGTVGLRGTEFAISLQGR
jgi:hypothetical protein